MEEEIEKVIMGLAGRSGNVMEILGYCPSDFQRGFDLANEMQNRDLIKILYSNFNMNKIIVECTLLAVQRYHDSRKG